MLLNYIQEALNHARYELIDDEEPYYGEISVLPGVWASGNSLEECRGRLIEVLEGWILLRVRNGLEIPDLEGKTISIPKEILVSD